MTTETIARESTSLNKDVSMNALLDAALKNNILPELSLHEICKRGEEIYERDLYPRLENTENLGKYVVIDVVGGDYEMDADELTAGLKLKARSKSGALYGKKVGYDAAAGYGGNFPKRIQR